MGKVAEGISIPDRAQALSGLLSFGAIRGVTGLAKSAIDTIGDKAASITQATSASFSEVMAQSPTVKDSDAVAHAGKDQGEPISRIRERLADAITQLLGGIGVPLDPPLAFVAGEDGHLHLENAHPRAAEIEANLRESPEVSSLTGQLLGSANAADRRLVLHSVAGA